MLCLSLSFFLFLSLTLVMQDKALALLRSSIAAIESKAEQETNLATDLRKDTIATIKVSSVVTVYHLSNHCTYHDDWSPLIK